MSRLDGHCRRTGCNLPAEHRYGDVPLCKEHWIRLWEIRDAINKETYDTPDKVSGTVTRLLDVLELP